MLTFSCRLSLTTFGAFASWRFQVVGPPQRSLHREASIEKPFNPSTQREFVALQSSGGEQHLLGC